MTVEGAERVVQSSHVTFTGIKVGKINPILCTYQEFEIR